MNGYTSGGLTILAVETTTWFIYYIYRHGAYRYADMLDQQKDQYY